MTIFTSGRDQGLVLLLEMFDPFHAMWAASNGGKPIALFKNGIHTIN